MLRKRKYLHFYRKKAGMKQNKLAESVEQEPSYISRIENGLSKPGLGVLVAMANSLGITADDLLCSSLAASSATYAREFEELLSDCTTEERKFIIALAHDIKKRMREVNWEAQKTLPCCKTLPFPSVENSCCIR